jgi:hypothetical protein
MSAIIDTVVDKNFEEDFIYRPPKDVSACLKVRHWPSLDNWKDGEQFIVEDWVVNLKVAIEKETDSGRTQQESVE